MIKFLELPYLELARSYMHDFMFVCDFRLIYLQLPQANESFANIAFLDRTRMATVMDLIIKYLSLGLRVYRAEFVNYYI